VRSTVPGNRRKCARGELELFQTQSVSSPVAQCGLKALCQSTQPHRQVGIACVKPLRHARAPGVRKAGRGHRRLGRAEAAGVRAPGGKAPSKVTAAKVPSPKLTVKVLLRFTCQPPAASHSRQLCRLCRYHPYAMYCPVLLSQPWDALLAQPCMMGVSEFSCCGSPPRFGAAGGDRTGDRTAKCAFWS